MVKTNDFLQDSQIKDYQSCFQNSGFSPDDFELLQNREQSSGPFYDPQAGEVIVRCKTTGVKKTYRLSSGNTWPMEFHDDLGNGFFTQIT